MKYIGVVLLYMAGMICGMWLMALENIRTIEECQENLPRDQYCTIIAVPEKDLENYQ